MNAAQLTTALVFAQTCGGGSSPSPATDEVESTWSCDEYQIMLEVETRYGGGCETDDECTVILDGTGDDCESTNETKDNPKDWNVPDRGRLQVQGAL